MKKLNLNNVIDNMSLKDQFKLIIRDHQLRVQTKGEKYLLTEEDKDRVYKDIQDKNLYSEYTKLNNLYNFGVDMTLNLKDAYNAFMKVHNLLWGILIGTVSSYVWQEAFDDLIYDSKCKDISDPEKVDEVFLRARKKYLEKNKSIGVVTLYNSIEPQTNKIPNTLLAIIVIKMVEAVKDYRIAEYFVEVVEKAIGFNFMSERIRNSMKSFNKDIEDFIELKNAFIPLRLYQIDIKNGDIKAETENEKVFVEMMKDLEKACSIDDKLRRKELGEMLKLTSIAKYPIDSEIIYSFIDNNLEKGKSN